MKYTIHPVPTEHLGWILQRTGCIITSDFKAIAALDSNGIIKGMVAYCNWTANCVQMHSAIDNPAALRALVVDNGSPIFRYPFIECKRGIVIGAVRATNEEALRIDKHLGFRETHRIKDGVFVGEDMVILEMRREECRWINRTSNIRREPKPVEQLLEASHA